MRIAISSGSSSSAVSRGQQSRAFSLSEATAPPGFAPLSDREIRDEQLITDLRAVHKDNFSVYGVKKMHRAMKRKGWRLGREQTRRLMRKAGLRGVQRGKPVFTTVTDPADARPADLANRQFKAASLLFSARISQELISAQSRPCAQCAAIATVQPSATTHDLAIT